ncbi:MAG TPA: DUF4296 domain-containing protein [Cyclobacteriaceae bacterium]|nr:DUF4296 domain-containing protein [Cyclobacteriaceae bacterium]
MVSTINLTKGSYWKTILVVVISLLSLYSCKKAGRPDDVLSQEELADLMVEFYLAEGKINSLGIQRDSAMKLFLPFEQSVMTKKKVSDETLSRTYRYYLDHPLEFEKVYDAVIDTLSLRETKANRIQPR